VQEFLVKPEDERTLGRPRRKWENDIKMDFKEIGWGNLDWIGLAGDRESGRFL
jgi:hypothetical protein